MSFIFNPQNKKIVDHIINLRWTIHGEQLNNIILNKETGSKRIVCQYDLNHNFIRTWNSITEIEQIMVFPRGQIRKVYTDKRSNIGGYIWKYLVS